MTTSAHCPTCNSHYLEYIGLQWFPVRIFETHHAVPAAVDTSRPDEGAVEMYTCLDCETSFVDLLQAVACGD